LTIGDLMEFLKNARQEDLKEIEAVTGHSIYEEPLGILEDAKVLQHSSGKILGIGGYSIAYAGLNEAVVVTPWLVLTTHVHDHPVEFLRFSKRYLQEKLLKMAPKVSNAVYGTNFLHINWLSWLGCKWVQETDTSKVFLFERGEGD